MPLAFPGAIGQAKNITHCRDANLQLRFIQNLTDGGPNSFRQAVDGPQGVPRLVIFQVGGTIHGQSSIVIGNDNFTLPEEKVYIAGQTAYGDGILIRGDSFGQNCTNVLIRFMRFRSGDDPQEFDNGRSCSSFRGSSNLYYNRCDMMWATDICTSAQHGATGLTWDNCVVSEGLAKSSHHEIAHNYSYQFSLGGGSGPVATLYRVLMTNQAYRLPLIQSGAIQCISCLAYNWGALISHFARNTIHPNGPTTYDCMGYKAIIGPNTDGYPNSGRAATWPIVADGANSETFQSISVYVQDNFGSRRKQESDPDSDEVGSSLKNQANFTLAGSPHFSDSQTLLAGFDGNDTLLHMVTNDDWKVGIRRIFPDADEERLLQQVRDNTGQMRSWDGGVTSLPWGTYDLGVGIKDSYPTLDGTPPPTYEQHQEPGGFSQKFIDMVFDEYGIQLENKLEAPNGARGTEISTARGVPDEAGELNVLYYVNWLAQDPYSPALFVNGGGDTTPPNAPTGLTVANYLAVLALGSALGCFQCHFEKERLAHYAWLRKRRRVTVDRIPWQEKT